MGGSTGRAEGTRFLTHRCPAVQLQAAKGCSRRSNRSVRRRGGFPESAARQPPALPRPLRDLFTSPISHPASAHGTPQALPRFWCSPSFGQTRSAPGGPAGDRGGSDLHGSGSAYRFPGQPPAFPRAACGRGTLTQRSRCQPGAAGGGGAAAAHVGQGALVIVRGAGGDSRASSAPQPGTAGNGGPPHVTWAWARSSP